MMIGPAVCSNDCFKTLCNSRTLPGQPYCISNVQRIRADFLHFLAKLAAETMQEMFEQQQQIVAALAQCRQLDREAVQPVVEIAAKLIVGDHVLQIAIRGGDDAHIGLQRRIAADALEPLLLKNAQHLALDQRRHIADFIQEDRAARALLEFADAAAARRR